MVLSLPWDNSVIYTSSTEYVDESHCRCQCFYFCSFLSSPVLSYGLQPPDTQLSLLKSEFTWLQLDSVSVVQPVTSFKEINWNTCKAHFAYFSFLRQPYLLSLGIIHCLENHCFIKCVCLFCPGGVSGGRVNLDPTRVCFYIENSVNYKSSYPDISRKSPRWHNYFNNHHVLTSNCIQNTNFKTSDRKRNSIIIMTSKLKIIIFLSRPFI